MYFIFRLKERERRAIGNFKQRQNGIFLLYCCQRILGFCHYQRNRFCFSLFNEDLSKVSYLTKSLLKGEC